MWLRYQNKCKFDINSMWLRYQTNVVILIRYQFDIISISLQCRYDIVYISYHGRRDIEWIDIE